MSTSELRCFDAVARSGSFMKAAQDLGRSQPTITIQISQLERSYGVLLLDRGRGRKVRLTSFGEKLYEITSRLFALERDALTYLKDGAELSAGHLRIGASAPTSATPIIMSFRERFPQLDISLIFGNSTEILAALRASEIDIAFLGGDGDYPDCDCVPLTESEIVLIGSARYRAASNGLLNVAQLKHETMLMREPGSQTRRLFSEFLAREYCTPKAVIEVGSREGICAAAAAGLGLAVISENEILPGFELQIIRLKGHRVVGRAFVLCLKERRFAAAVDAFMKRTKNRPG